MRIPVSTRPDRLVAPLRLLVTLSCLVGGGSVLAAGADDLDRFEPMDVFDLEWADDPRVAPGGETVAYVRRGYDVMADRTTARIWLVDADGGNHRPLTDGPGYAPRWSPGRWSAPP